MLVDVLHQNEPCGDSGFFGIHARAEMVVDHETSLPLTRMLMALAVPAIVEINPPEGKICPTSSGKRYVSDAAKVRCLTIKLLLPAASVAVTKLMLIVADEPLKLVAVNLSMIVVTPLAVYCVV